MNFDFRKKRTKLPELGSWGGGLGNSGNARKKTFFFCWPLPLGKIIFRLWQAFDYIGLSEWQLSWTIFFRNLPWKVNFVMARFLWIVRVSIKLMHISMYICVVGGFHLFIVFTSTRTIRYSDSTLFFHLQSSATNQETPKYFAHNNCKSFSRKAHQTHLLKLIDVFIIHHFEMILESA